MADVDVAQDRDADRILDSVDACPVDAEVYNGFEDADGCPDRGAVVIEGQSLVILENLGFLTNVSTPSREDAQILVAVAETLRANPEINRIAVRGFAESHERNPADLSLARAEAVVRELIRLGVDEGRLVAEGLGTATPHSDGGPVRQRAAYFRILEANGMPTGVDDR